MGPLKKSIEDAGGVQVVALACGKSPRAVYKWLAAEILPRTEYTGETKYAERIASLASANGKPFKTAWLLAEAHPNKPAIALVMDANVRNRDLKRQTVDPSVCLSSTQQASP